MTTEPTFPPHSIRVVAVSRTDWTFEYPRLDSRAFDMFLGALEHREAGDLGKAEADLRLLLEGFPEFIDAHHHLALILSETDRPAEARRIWETAVGIGRTAFPGTFRRGRHRLPWVMLDNRPFLRVMHAWGLELFEEGETVQALDVFNEILSMNPNDNQGIRALAVDCCFRLRKPEQVLAVCLRYPDDMLEEILYGRPLALFQLKVKRAARSTLRSAVETLPLVAAELLKKRHDPPKGLDPSSVTFGGRDQAYYYWLQNGQHWKNTKGALQFLASVVASRK